jgi:hypothetical protein
MVWIIESARKVVSSIPSERTWSFRAQYEISQIFIHSSALELLHEHSLAKTSEVTQQVTFYHASRELTYELRRMASSGMLCRVAIVKSDVSEVLSAFIIRVTGIGELGTLGGLLVTANVVPSSPIHCHPDDGGAKFLRNIGSYKSHTA